MPDTLLENLSRSLDRSLLQPLYEQISEHLEAMIRDGSLKPKDRLPTEVDFAAGLHVHHRTVSRALGQLVDKRLLVRTRRVGTYVSSRVGTERTNIVYGYPIADHERMLNRGYVIQGRLQETPYDLKLLGFDEANFDAQPVLDLMTSSDTAGGLLTPFNHPEHFKLFQTLEREGIPYVRLGNRSFGQKLNAPTVMGDDGQGLHDALTFLHETLGHERIGYLSHNKPPFIDDVYWNFLHDHTGVHEPRWKAAITYDNPPTDYPGRPDILQALRGYLRRNPELTAVIAPGFPVILDLLRVAREEGREPGKDLSILGLFDWPGLIATTPPVTSMAIDNEQMVDMALEELENLIDLPKDQRYRQPGAFLKAHYTLRRAEGGSVAALVSKNASG